MHERWSLISVNRTMLISVGYPSRERALMAALDLYDEVGHDPNFYVEGPNGQRIDQPEIKIMHSVPQVIAQRAS
jgi:hypothetical protein